MPVAGEPATRPASQRVVTGAGFELEGVLRSFLPLGDARQDMQVWSRIRTPR